MPMVLTQKTNMGIQARKTSSKPLVELFTVFLGEAANGSAR